MYLYIYIYVYLFPWYKASTAKQTRTALFWVITQPLAVICYRRFRTTYLVPFSGFKNPKPFSILDLWRPFWFSTSEDRTDRVSRNVSKKISTTGCVMTYRVQFSIIYLYIYIIIIIIVSSMSYELALSFATAFPSFSSFLAASLQFLTQHLRAPLSHGPQTAFLFIPQSVTPHHCHCLPLLHAPFDMPPATQFSHTSL
jgi:hypothetical protein